MTQQNDFFEEDPATEKALRISQLIAGYLRQSLTPAEHDELDEWVGESDANMRIFEELTDTNKLQEGVNFIESVQTGKMRKKLKDELVFNKPRPQYRIFQYSAAACLLLLVGISAYFFLRNNDRKPNHIAEIVEKNQDLQPGKNKATLTLADGKHITLDAAKNGMLASQGNSEVVKENGHIVYNNKQVAIAGNEILYNTITTPRGGTYILTLSDGTKIWMNAASSITFPTAFTGTERKVTVTGEAYFEVSKNKAMPFMVDIKDRGTSVQVLGTHFNINAYADEPELKTTLFEGSVKIVSKVFNKVVFLKPGQQAKVNNNKLTVESDVNLDRVIAWKEGMFRFDGTDLQSIMRDLSRWYNVEVKFETNSNPKYNSIFPKTWVASKIFAVLEENGGVHFKIDGNKVIVLQ